MQGSTERRRFQRHPIQLVGQIGKSDGTQAACVVRDCCPGGLLLQQIARARRLSAVEPGQTIRVSVRPETTEGVRPIELDVTVAWVRDDYLGVSFSEPLSETFELLRQHMQVSRQDPDRPSRPPIGGEARALSKFRHLANGLLPGFQDELLQDVEQALSGVLDKGLPDNERQQLYAEMSMLERLRQDDGVIRAVLRQAEGRASDGAAEKSDDADAQSELSLVEPDDFERWLEASRLSNLLDRDFDDRLNGLVSRFAALRRPELQSSPTVPFVPQHFAAALKEVSIELELGHRSRRALFDGAARLLSRQLGELYSAFDKVLDEVGAPDVLTVHRSGLARDVPRAEASGAARAGDRSAGEDNHGKVVVDEEVLVRLLENERSHRGVLAKDLMAEVAELPNMTESLAAWLHLLEGPVTREAQQDPGFFQDQKHPLRKIVDALGHLQMFRPQSDIAPADDAIRQHVSDLLRPVEDGTADPDTLESIGDALDVLNREQSLHYQHNVERVAEAAEGRDRVRHARRVVLDEINRRYAGRNVPDLLPELLNAGWRAVLELAVLKHQSAEGAYGEYLQLIDELVARLGGEAFDSQSGDIDALDLCQRIEVELATVSFDPFRRNAIENRLRKALTGLPPASVALVEMQALTDESLDNGVVEPPADMPVEAQEVLNARCRALAVGDRVVFLNAPEGPQELRVAWMPEDRALFVMVDHRGLRAKEVSRNDLLRGLYQRHIEIIPADGRPLSDRAVDALLERMEVQLEHQTAHDSLTGLINREQFQAALGRAIGTSEQSGDLGTLLCIDLDQFRLVNDIHGYDTGDRLLIALARQLEQHHDTKFLAHLGGDRFAIVVPEDDPAEAQRRAEAICEAVGRLDFDWPGQPVALTASAGLVSLGMTTDSAGGLLQAADNALAAAKAAGGNLVFVYNEDDPDIASRRMSAQRVAQVDQALDHDRLRLRCQPIVPLRAGAGLQPHYEVLLDVTGDPRDTLSVTEFIAAAERYRRMRAIDRWVTQTVVEWIAEQHAQMADLHGFAVNLSGQTASDPEFVDFVKALFAQYQIDPSWLSFEVTETAAVADLGLSAGIIQELKTLGCRVALDDFGSGLASYSYLKELPVDWLKIDGVFVRKIAADRADLAVVKSINDIGHFLGKETIAEYVADDSILRLVREIGVDYGQGYAISPPIPLDELLPQEAEA